MTEHGLICCGEMVRAFLAGRKTQTRRVIICDDMRPLGPHGSMWPYRRGKDIPDMPAGVPVWKPIKPRYQPGDHLYIKEIWATEKKYDDLPPRAIPAGASIWFSDHLGWKRDKHMGKVRSSRFMLKRIARLWYEVVEVKDPHRIQDISEEDCIAEGIEVIHAEKEKGHLFDGIAYWDSVSHDSDLKERTYHLARDNGICCCHAGQKLQLPPTKCAFRVLWEFLHGPGAWERNDYVFPYVLKEIEK